MLLPSTVCVMFSCFNRTPTHDRHRIWYRSKTALFSTMNYPFAVYTTAEIPMLFSGLDNSQKLPLPMRGSWPHLLYGFKSQPPNGIAIGSAVFKQYISVINTQTPKYRPRYMWHLSQQATSMPCMQCSLGIIVQATVGVFLQLALGL